MIRISILMLGLFSITTFASPMAPTGSIELPGQVGKRFDYLTVDEDHGYLLSAHLGAGLLYVIDLKTQRLVSAIAGLPGIEGVEYIPGLSKVYTSNWGDHTIGVVDLTTMTVLKKIPAENKPDGSAYAPPFGKIYVSDERAKAVFVIDVHTDEIVATLRFSSETGMPQYDPVAMKVYVNLQDENRMVEIDPSSDSISSSYAVPGCQGNHGMVLDSTRRRAFLACEGNDVLAVMNLTNHQILTTIALPPGVDVIKYDVGLGRIYAACYSGFISVIQADGADHYRKLEDYPVQPKVHSLGIDPATHRIYAPEQEENGVPVSRMIIYDAVGMPPFQSRL